MRSPRPSQLAARRLGPPERVARPVNLSILCRRSLIPLALLVGLLLVFENAYGFVVGVVLAAGSTVPMRTYTPLLTVPRVTRWTALATCSALIVLTWWLSSFGRHHGVFYLIGPYHVPVLLEWALGVGVFAAACVGRVLTARQGLNDSRYSSLTVAFLAVASVLGTVGWRAVTPRGEGANIGAGFVLLVGPLFVAGLLQLALTAERVARSGHLRCFVATSIGI